MRRGLTFWERGFTLIESYSNNKCVIESPDVCSDGNSQKAVDNVQTVAKPLFKQHEDL